MIQRYLDRQNSIFVSIYFPGPTMTCRKLSDHDTCSELTRTRLRMLVEAGLISRDAYSPAFTTFQITKSGKHYVYRASTVNAGPLSQTAYIIEIGRPVISEIRSYTLPGVDRNGATSTIVRFAVRDRPYKWVIPYLSRDDEERGPFDAPFGRRGHGTAHLELTNVGWVVAESSLNFAPERPQP